MGFQQVEELLDGRGVGVGCVDEQHAGGPGVGAGDVGAGGGGVVVVVVRRGRWC